MYIYIYTTVRIVSLVAYLHTMTPMFYDIPILFNNFTFPLLFTSYIYFYFVNKPRTMQCALQNVIRCRCVFLCMSYFTNSTLRERNSMKEKKTNFKAINWALRPGSYKTHSFSRAFRWERYYRMFSIICCLPASASRAGGNRMGKRMGEWDGILRDCFTQQGDSENSAPFTMNRTRQSTKWYINVRIIHHMACITWNRKIC